MKNKSITAIAVIFILLVAGLVIYTKNAGSAVKDIATEAEAKWIGEHSVLYVLTTCSHCKEQETLFGNNVKYLNIIDEKDLQKFEDAEVDRTPTWIINRQKYVGVQSIERLKELTGYSSK